MISNQYSDFVVPLIRSFRSEIMTCFGKVEHGVKSDNTVVTEIDRSIEKKIRKRLEEEFPEIGIHGEEFGVSGSKDKYWLVDPIDGTLNYIRGIPGIGTIIGLVEKGKIVFASIYDPINDDVFWALKGKGAYKNKQKIRVSDNIPEHSIIEIDCHKDLGLNSKIIKMVSDNCTFIKTHGAAFRAFLIAGGKIEGTIRYKSGGSDWDYAPGNFIAKEAGAIVTYYDIQDELKSRSFSVLTKNNHKVYDGILKQEFKKAFEDNK